MHRSALSRRPGGTHRSASCTRGGLAACTARHRGQRPAARVARPTTSKNCGHEAHVVQHSTCGPAAVTQGTTAWRHAPFSVKNLPWWPGGMQRSALDSGLAACVVQRRWCRRGWSGSTHCTVPRTAGWRRASLGLTASTNSELAAASFGTQLAAWQRVPYGAIECDKRSTGSARCQAQVTSLSFSFVSIGKPWACGTH